MLRKSDYTGRIAKWATKLGAYDVKYLPHTAIKGQVLADFVVEFAEGACEEAITAVSLMISSTTTAPVWRVYADGASNRKGAGGDSIDHA